MENKEIHTQQATSLLTKNKRNQKEIELILREENNMTLFMPQKDQNHRSNIRTRVDGLK